MKAVIFAGGVGTRLWPVSRRSYPKQFEKVIGDKSTLQLSVDRLRPDFDWSDIYIATNKQYGDLVKTQLPDIPSDNIILEPEMRDVGPAVGLVTTVLASLDPHSPFAILWSDHLVKKIDLFKKVLSVAEDNLKKNPNKIIFLGQKPRFASQNLGWIEFGDKIKTDKGITFYKFKSWHYRPDLASANNYFKSGHHAWNPGYFISTPQFILNQYKKYAPQMYKDLIKIKNSLSKPSKNQILENIYPTMPKISFDNVILEQIPPEIAEVAAVDLGWSDVGAWEALKEALQTSPEQNVTQGKVLIKDCQDCLVYNYTDQLLTTIDLKGHLVVNTKDVTLVCHKDSVPKIKKLVEHLAETEDSNLT
ncbi:MAG: sugar phosphate nucleotidyltransferase [Candidatus Gottesmanbacteria bacterium]